MRYIGSRAAAIETELSSLRRNYQLVMDSSISSEPAEDLDKGLVLV